MDNHALHMLGTTHALTPGVSAAGGSTSGHSAGSDLAMGKGKGKQGKGKGKGKGGMGESMEAFPKKPKRAYLCSKLWDQ